MKCTGVSEEPAASIINHDNQGMIGSFHIVSNSFSVLSDHWTLYIPEFLATPLNKLFYFLHSAALSELMKCCNKGKEK
jgi:hypothetical protein